MYLIVGLGNPERKYDGTRHNVGFEAIDAISKQFGIEVNHKEHKGIVGKGIINGKKVILVKPQTYMNLSGECVLPLTDYYEIDPSTEMVVISDDVSLSTGNIRVRKKGSAGGHNGLKNIINLLGTNEFPRIRVGVGECEGDMVAHVLGRYNAEDRERVDASMEKVIGAVELFLDGDLDAAMNKYNKKEEK
ncbi:MULTISPECIES: aminoacyl-tRNA hydrolase [Pseudobutyrivibrio]|uniref:Peptidyl-tRNA hydrolase n=1 Tax=Pseudobutyrivibrio xylanivorans TaxID=185007 RepID=A0A1G5RRF2_PSEXY|nr:MULTISPECIES: aminoacyl-tRNA hydrolase [Pseudobutyrivibrio]MDC7279150.1 aminoacyl-tRNA hydrolase [Butyrivibrio fibrisolvens]SCZ76011.1 peptidyl-tRNA hydrolase, PTH1 family [Pseudobutyrivibrio xylanivorans]